MLQKQEAKETKKVLRVLEMATATCKYCKSKVKGIGNPKFPFLCGKCLRYNNVA